MTLDTATVYKIRSHNQGVWQCRHTCFIRFRLSSHESFSNSLRLAGSVSVITLFCLSVSMTRLMGGAIRPGDPLSRVMCNLTFDNRRSLLSSQEWRYEERTCRIPDLFAEPP